MGKNFKDPLGAEDILSFALVGAGVDYAIARRTTANRTRILCSVGVAMIVSLALRLTR